MIDNFDRAYWLGASDTRYLFMKPDTKTYMNWWAVKQGKLESNFGGSIYTDFGSRAEHPIMDKVEPLMVTDVQLLNTDLRLRINYDGMYDGNIYEIKTFKGDKNFEINKGYWYQAQVEMFMYQEYYTDFKELNIVAYKVLPDEYYQENEIVIDESRLEYHKVDYDRHWIKEEYLPRVKPLAKSLKKLMRKENIPEDWGVELF